MSCRHLRPLPKAWRGQLAASHEAIWKAAQRTFSDSSSERTAAFPSNQQLRHWAALGVAAAARRFRKRRNCLLPCDCRRVEARSASRRALGGNGAVSRVLVADQRILLETSRIIVRVLRPTRLTSAGIFSSCIRLLKFRHPGLPAYTIKAAANVPARDAAMLLMREQSVVYAEPDFIEHIGERYTPKDPNFGKQWHHAALKARTRLGHEHR